MKTFSELFSALPWRPIPNCPGRFVLRGGPCALSPREIVGEGPVLEESLSPRCADAVIVARLDSGGLISYRKGDGRYIHTLNDSEGFGRKLSELGMA